MFDYKLIEALAAVLQEGGFDRAAKALHLTQSAVSQRVKLLEEQTGQILLARTTPPQPTPAGQKLLKHYLQINRLEDDLRDEIGNQTKGEEAFTTIAVGINADSLATWFLEAILPLLREERFLLDIRVDDQDQTHRMLRDGEVMACVSTQPQPMQGCATTRLGCMRYRAFAAPAFAARWFPNGLIDADACRCAPIVLFNRKDEVHCKLFQHLLGETPSPLPSHYVPSSEKFVDCIAAGIGYGILPDQQSQGALLEGRIVDLAPGHSVPVQLYWHCWNLDAPSINRLTSRLTREARLRLAQ